VSEIGAIPYNEARYTEQNRLHLAVEAGRRTFDPDDSRSRVYQIAGEASGGSLVRRVRCSEVAPSL
jgi:hypothetical protein